MRSSSTGCGPPASDGDTTNINSKTPRQTRHAIPPLSKSTATPLSIRRRLDMRLPRHPSESDPLVSLSQRLNEMALERSHTPRKTRDIDSKAVSSSSVPMPSPGLKKIRERLAAEKENSSSTSHRRSAADDAAAAAAASTKAAERSAARAFESIFEQEEELLSAMSTALASSGMPTPSRDKSSRVVLEGVEEEENHGGNDEGKGSSKMRQAMLSRVAKSIEDVTREQLDGLAAADDGSVADLKITAVYWITMARFEECHDRIEAARAYLREGLDYLSLGVGDGLAGHGVHGSSSTVQTNALRLALQRFEKRVAANGGGDEPTLTTMDVDTEGGKSPSRSSVAVKKSPGKAENATVVTPTRRSERIRRKSREQGK